MGKMHCTKVFANKILIANGVRAASKTVLINNTYAGKVVTLSGGNGIEESNPSAVNRVFRSDISIVYANNTKLIVAAVRYYFTNGVMTSYEQIEDISVVYTDCSSDSCRVDCAGQPDGFCCIDHSVTNRMLQVITT